MYELTPVELRLLEDAANEADLVDYMNAEWRRKGRPTETKGSRNQIVAHPALGELREHRGMLKSLMGGLNLPPLDDGSDDDGGIVIEIKSPERKMTRSEVGKLGAKTRWKNHGIVGD